jgi:hypothetical protein
MKKQKNYFRFNLVISILFGIILSLVLIQKWKNGYGDLRLLLSERMEGLNQEKAGVSHR